MARLTRKNIKVFADSASNNGVFGSLQAGNPTVSNDVETLQSLTAWNYGWNSATMTSEKLPPLEEIQGVTYVTTYQQAYLMQEGMPEWAATVTYYKGSLVKKVTTNGFQIYNSLTNNNLNHQLSDTSNWKLVMDSDNLYALDNSVVHLAGAETITGAKTFTKNIDLTNNTESYRHISSTNTAITKGTTPSANTGTDFLFKDSQNSTVGNFSIWYNTGGIIRSGFRAYAPTAESTGYGELVMDTTETGSQLSFITYNGLNNTNLWGASSDTSRNLVALQGWVNNPSMSTNVVHRSGNENITGRKVYTDTTTFTTHPVVQSTTEYSSIGYRVQNTQITRGTAPTTGNATGQWVFQDAGGLGVNNRIGGMEVTYLTDGSIRTSLQVFQPAASTTQNPYTYSTLALIYPASGDPYTYCTASDVANSIVTTVNKNKSANGYFQLGNGLIVQWGRLQIHVHTDKTVYTITLPKAFTSTNYTFCTCFENNTSSSPSVTDDVTFVTTSISTTQVKGFGFDAGNNYYDAYIRWIAIGY